MKSMKFCNMHLVGVTGGWLTKRAADKSQRARLKIKLRVALAANASPLGGLAQRGELHMDDSEALVAMKIYQQRHGGNLAEISILFANVVSALKEAAQQSVQADFCPRCGGSRVIQENFKWVDCPSCVNGKSR